MNREEILQIPGRAPRILPPPHSFPAPLRFPNERLDRISSGTAAQHSLVFLQHYVGNAFFLELSKLVL